MIRMAGAGMTLALFFVPVVLAQPAQNSRQRQGPVDIDLQEAVEVRLLDLLIVARDDDGNPVLNLRPEEILVKSGGEELQVRYLDSIFDEPPPDDPLPQIKLHVKLGAEYQTTVTMPREPDYFIYFVDVENNDLTGRQGSLARMQEFVREMRDGDLAAVVSYNGNLGLEQGFTDDRELIAEALTSAFARRRRPVDTLQNELFRLIEEIELCEDSTDQTQLPSGDIAMASATDRRPDAACLYSVASQYRSQRRPRVRSYLRSLEGTIRLAAGLSGRATVFAYSHGISVDTMTELYEAFRSVWGHSVNEVLIGLMGEAHEQGAMDRVIRLAAAEEVAFHFIDPSTVSTEATATRQPGILQPNSRPMEVAFTAPQATLSQVAEMSGGHFWTDDNVLDALRKAMAFESGRYRLGVYLATDKKGKKKKKPPKLKIASKRPGVRLEYGRSRFTESTDLDSVEGTIAQGEIIDLPGKPEVLLPFMLGVKSEQLGYARHKDVMAADLTLHMVLQTADGRHLASFYRLLEHSFPVSQDVDHPAAVLSIRGGVEAPPGDYRLLVLVRNSATGQGGRLIRELTIGAPDEGSTE